MLPGFAPRTLYLVDGTAQLFRAYHAIGGLTNPAGLPTNAVYGFTSMLRKLVRDERAQYLAVAFDLGGDVFRHASYALYKANREPTPEDLEIQMPYAKEVCAALNLVTLELAGFEADDLIATCTVQARLAGFDVVVVASDKDLLQLVGDGVTVLNPTTGARLDAAGVALSFGVGPQRVRDVLALMGDAVDNVPGVPGVGQKTALGAVATYGDLEAVLLRARRFVAAFDARDDLLNALEQAVAPPTPGVDASERLRSSSMRCSTSFRELAEVEPESAWRQALLAAQAVLEAGDLPSVQTRPAKPLAALRRQLKDLERGTSRRAWYAMAEHADQARLSLELVTLHVKAPIEFSAERFAVKPPDVERARVLFGTLGFRSLLEEFGGTAAPAVERPAVSVETVTDKHRLAEVAAACRRAGRLAVVCEADGSDPLRARLTGLALSYAEGQAVHVPFGAPAAPGGMIPDEAWEALGALLADPAAVRIGADVKRDLHLLRRHGLATASFTLDASVAAFLLESQRSDYAPESLAREFLGRAGPPESSAAARAEALFALADPLRQRLAAADLLLLYETMDGPLLPILAEMEAWGVRIDTVRLESMSREMEIALDRARLEVHALAGVEFNLDSPKQLRDVLFDRLGLRPRRRTAKEGVASTDAATLDELAAEHPIAGRLLAYRELAKLKGTYVDALPRLVHPETGRVHTRFDPTGAATGRLSSSEPNLQNIPLRTEAGRRIREAFVPEPGWVFLASDYSQIELRVLAHLSQDAGLVAAFRAGEDIHLRTASSVFDVPAALVTDGLRRRAKAINFGVLYGMSETRLAREQGLSRADARRFIAAYFTRFAGVANYIEMVRERALREGCVRTLFGRLRSFPELRRRSDRVTREQALRAAVNTTIQGTAADLMKMAMIQVAREIRRTGLGARMLLQVHDELLLEVREEAADEAAALVRGAMEQVYGLDVPLVVDSRVGLNWLAVS